MHIILTFSPPYSYLLSDFSTIPTYTQTPLTPAPEVISLDPLGAYSDMWSVGVIVYIMVSGYSPFMGDDDNETYGNISTCSYEFYEDEFANISDDCKDLIKNLFIIKHS